MARITVEDCLDKVDNRFELVMIASKRARQLQIEGKDPLLPVDNDKPSVISLREIADGLVNKEILIEKPSVELEQELESETTEAAADAENSEDSETASAETESDSETDSEDSSDEDDKPDADK